MDEFVGFNYLLLDGSAGPPQEAKVVERGEKRERVDLIARQFRDFLQEPPHGAGADAPRGLIMTHDFKLRGRATAAAGWLVFLVDRGDGTDGGESLEAVALLAFARDGGEEEVRRALRQHAPHAADRQLPPAPLAVAVLLAEKVPSAVREVITVAAAGFFSDEFRPSQAAS